MAMRKESAVGSWIPPIGTRRSGAIDLAEKSRIILPHPALLDPVQDALHMIRGLHGCGICQAEQLLKYCEIGVLVLEEQWPIQVRGLGKVGVEPE